MKLFIFSLLFMCFSCVASGQDWKVVSRNDSVFVEQDGRKIPVNAYEIKALIIEKEQQKAKQLQRLEILKEILFLEEKAAQLEIELKALNQILLKI